MLWTLSLFRLISPSGQCLQASKLSLPLKSTSSNSVPSREKDTVPPTQPLIWHLSVSAHHPSFIYVRRRASAYHLSIRPPNTCPLSSIIYVDMHLPSVRLSSNRLSMCVCHLCACCLSLYRLPIVLQSTLQSSLSPARDQVSLQCLMSLSLWGASQSRALHSSRWDSDMSPHPCIQIQVLSELDLGPSVKILKSSKVPIPVGIK